MHRSVYHGSRRGKGWRTERQRILWLIKGLARGGAERLVSVMAPRLQRSRYDVCVAYLLPEADAFVPDLRSSDVEVVCLDAGRSVEPGWPRRLRALLRDEPFDIVHTHSPMPAAVARVLSPRRTRLVHTEHNMWDVYRASTFVANAVTYHRNDVVFAVSDRVADSIERPWWSRMGRTPDVEVLLHGVDPDTAPRGPEARARARTALALAPDALVIGNVANFSPKKDQHGLVEAFAMVRSEVPGVTLLLIGMGPLEEELRATVTSQGLDDAVRFLGSRDDVPALLPALDLFVLSSRYEGLPISLLEAMAAEVACVSTRVGGIPEALRDGVEGRLVPPSNAAALAAALTDLLKDSNKRAALATAGQRRVAAEFSIDGAVERTHERYAQLLA